MFRQAQHDIQMRWLVAKQPHFPAAAVPQRDMTAKRSALTYARRSS
jgi:hypothetical protein